jgi:hypothetical protein
MKQAIAQGLGVVIAFAIILGVMVAFVAPLQVDPPQVADVDTYGYDKCGIGGLDARGYGAWTDPAGDTRKRGEVYTTSRLWYAWWEDGTSRPVTTAAYLIACGPLGLSAPQWVLYRFSYRESPSAAWTGFVQDTIPTGVNRAFVTFQGTGVGLQIVHLPPFELILDGFTFKPCTYPTTWDDTSQMGCTPGTTTQSIKDGAALKVEVIVERKGFLNGNYAPTTIATDEIELRSPIPGRFEWASGGYEVGQTAVLEYEVPTTEYEVCATPATCTYSPAYFITITDMNTNLPIAGWDRTAVSVRQGSVRVTVAEEFFSNDLAVCQNRLRAQLYTEIIQVNQDDTAVKANSTVLTVGEAPSVSEVTFDKEEYQEGDTVTISWTTEGNVSRVHVTAQTAGLVALDEDFTDADGETNFRAAATGILEVEVTPYNLCQPGDVKEVQATVGNVLPELCELFPEAKDCGEDFGNILIIALGIIGLLILLVLLMWVFSKIGSIPPLLQLGIPILIVVALAAFMLGTGFFATGLTVLPGLREGVRK